MLSISKYNLSVHRYCLAFFSSSFFFCLSFFLYLFWVIIVNNLFPLCYSCLLSSYSFLSIFLFIFLSPSHYRFILCHLELRKYASISSSLFGIFIPSILYISFLLAFFLNKFYTIIFIVLPYLLFIILLPIFSELLYHVIVPDFSSLYTFKFPVKQSNLIILIHLLFIHILLFHSSLSSQYL